jgi:uncharacterized membrane protein
MAAERQARQGTQQRHTGHGTMGTRYNAIAGSSAERLAALSDGLFAVAMTLLVLDLRVPPMEAVHGEADLRHALIGLAPRVLIYLMSFLTLGIFWVGQQTQLNFVARSDRTLSWLHLAFLFSVSLMPFSTSLMAEYIAYRTALLVYWFNILLLGVVLYLTWRYAVRAGLTSAEVTPMVERSVVRRIFIAQGLYGFGALLCLHSTYWSIGFIFLVQAIYAIGPRTGPLSRI